MDKKAMIRDFYEKNNKQPNVGVVREETKKDEGNK